MRRLLIDESYSLVAARVCHRVTCNVNASPHAKCNYLHVRISEWTEDLDKLAENDGVDEKMKAQKFVHGEKMRMKNASLIDQSCSDVWKKIVGPGNVYHHHQLFPPMISKIYFLRLVRPPLCS